MASLQTLPLNSIAFCIGSVALYIMAFRIYRVYKLDKNPLGFIHTSLLFITGSFMLCLGIPFLLTKDPTILLWGDYAAVALLSLVFIGLARVFWFSVFRNKFSFWYLGVPIAAWWIFTLITDILYTTVDTSSSLVTYTSAPITLILKGIMFVIIPVPVSALYLRQATQAHERRTKIRLSSIGIIILAGSLSGALENFHGGGKGTASTGILRIGLFILLLIVALWPKHKAKPADSMNNAVAVATRPTTSSTIR